MDEWTRNLQAGYDRVAGEYAARIFDELAHKPLDRERLDRFAERAGPLGRVCDLGCGPGQVARYLHERGTDVFGVDLSAEMVAQARRLSPAIEFREGSMRALELPDAALGGIAAFYSLIHIPRAELITVLQELRRVLCPNGLLLLAFHIGDQTVHLDEWWGQMVSIDFLFFQRSEIEQCLLQAGFVIDESLEREPYPEVEHPSRRAYILARRPVA